MVAIFQKYENEKNIKLHEIPRFNHNHSWTSFNL